MATKAYNVEKILKWWPYKSCKISDGVWTEAELNELPEYELEGMRRDAWRQVEG